MSEITVPYLSEHEAPGQGMNKPPGYNPDSQDKETIELVNKLYEKAKKYRKRYDQKWIDYYKMFRGRQWKEVRPSYRHSEVINMVFETIQSMVPTLTDARPKLEFMPTVPTDPTQMELADIYTKVAENDWIHNNWLEVLTETVYDAHFYGAGLAYVGYDEKANLGLGTVLFESFDVFYAFPDPVMRSINDRRGEYFIAAEPTKVSKLKKEYPDVAKWITADVIDLTQGDKADIYQVMFKSPVDSKLIVEGPSGYDAISKDEALKITCYFKDDETEEEEEIAAEESGTPIKDDTGIGATMEGGVSGGNNGANEDGTGGGDALVNGDSDGTKPGFIQKKKYPNGRKIVLAGGILCEDGPIEWDDGQFPFVKLVNYLLPREFWGVSEVEQLEGPQKTFNKIVSFALDVMSLMGNPIWKVGTASGVDTDNLFNKPGLVVEGDDISQIQREPGVQLQPFVLDLLDRYKKYFDQISGQTDLSKGVEPQDVTAASAIEDLQQAQQTRLRLKSRHIDAFLQNFGKLYISRVNQKYSIPRIVRVTGDDGIDQFFQFHVTLGDPNNPDHVDSDTGMLKKFANVTTYNEGSAPTNKVIEITSDFDMKVSTGSTLPFAKESKGTQAQNLFRLGVIDDEELLKTVDWPNYEAVLQRVNAKKAAAAQQAQQMAAAQAAAKAGGGGPPSSPPATSARAA